MSLEADIKTVITRLLQNIDIYRKLSILKKYQIFTFAVSQKSKYQNSDKIDGGKNVEVFEPKLSSKTTQICLKYLI